MILSQAQNDGKRVRPSSGVGARDDSIETQSDDGIGALRDDGAARGTTVREISWVREEVARPPLWF